MENYNIVYLNDELYKVIIYSNSYINPIQYWKEISEEIQKSVNKEVIILFDMLLSNGENFNRFAKAVFDGKEIQFNTIEIINITDEKLLKKINSFYNKKIRILNNSVLTSSQKYKFARA